MSVDISMWGDRQDRQLHQQVPAVCAPQSRKSRHHCETGGNIFQAFGTFLGAGYPQQWWHSEEEEGEEGQIQSVGGKKILRSGDPFWSRHYQALNVTMDQECQEVTIDKWRTKTFSFSLSSWDQILQQRWVGRFDHQIDSCHELSAVLATLSSCEENIEEKCGLLLTRKRINKLILRNENLFPGIGPIAMKLRRAARLQLNSYQVWKRVWIYLIYLQWRK